MYKILTHVSGKNAEACDFMAVNVKMPRITERAQQVSGQHSHHPKKKMANFHHGQVRGGILPTCVNNCQWGQRNPKMKVSYLHAPVEHSSLTATSPKKKEIEKNTSLPESCQGPSLPG
jgi:hypothetical protein